MSLTHALCHEWGAPPVLAKGAIVFVVDDDISVRESLELLIRCEGWQPETFASAQEFLARPRTLVPSCLVLDFSLPGVGGQGPCKVRDIFVRIVERIGLRIFL